MQLGWIVSILTTKAQRSINMFLFSDRNATSKICPHFHHLAGNAVSSSKLPKALQENSWFNCLCYATCSRFSVNQSPVFWMGVFALPNCSTKLSGVENGRAKDSCFQWDAQFPSGKRTTVDGGKDHEISQKTVEQGAW